jgi:hypothetical protein
MDEMFNFFSNLFYRDESSNWDAVRKVPLRLNLSAESLNDVRIGDSPEKLRVFGRPDNSRPFKTGRFDYYFLGFDVEIENGKIINFSFKFNEMYQPDFVGCELNITLINGGQITANRFTKRQDVEQILGESPNKAFDKDEDYYYSSSYRLGCLSIYFSWLKNDRLEEIIVEKVDL